MINALNKIEWKQKSNRILCSSLEHSLCVSICKPGMSFGQYLLKLGLLPVFFGKVNFLNRSEALVLEEGAH